MSLIPLVVISGSHNHEHRVARSALVGWALVVFCPHVVNKTTLRSKGLSTFLAPKVVLRLDMKLQLGNAAEPVTAELARWPMALVCHVLNDLLVVQELGAAGVAFV